MMAGILAQDFVKHNSALIQPSAACAATCGSPLRNISKRTNAGNITIAPTMFARKIKDNRIPMSAWNCSAENIHVPTPAPSVKPVKITALPVRRNVR